jgi:outer membrane protein OmpA-like peptidoglycan-associated protein
MIAMKTLRLGLLSSMVALTACQTTPPVNPALEEARAAVNAASADPAVTASAAPELQRARDELAVAEQASKDGDDDEMRTHAYVAKQRARIATEVGARNQVEQQLAQSGVERERILTEARTRQAQTAEQRAAEAKQDAAAAQAQAANAQAQAAQAQNQAATAKAQADAERQRAEAQAQQTAQERERATQEQQRAAQEQQRAAQMQKDLEALAAKSTARGVVVTLQDVLFDTGKSQLRSGGVRSLERVADVLRNYPERRVLIEGFTDSQGNEQYNIDLSRRRANAVKEQLQALGVSDGRIETRALGESYPIADNGTAQGRQQNRRVELLFSDAQGHFNPR